MADGTPKTAERGSQDTTVQYPGEGPDDRTARRVAGLFRPYRGRVSVIAAAILLVSGLGIVLPFLTQAIFDRALFVEGGPELGLLTTLVLAMVGVTAISATIGVGQTYLTNDLGNRVMQDVRNRLFAHLQRMELAFFTSTKTGQIQSRLGNDVAGVQTVVTDTASSILANGVTVLSSFIAMFALSWQLSLVSLALTPLFVLLQVQVGRRRRKVAAQTQSSLADMTAITQESLSVSGMLLAKTFARQDLEVARFTDENARQARLQVRQAMTGQAFFALVQGFFGVTPALIYLTAGVLLDRPGGIVITAGTVVAFTTLQTRLLFPLVALLRVAVDVQTSLALFARVFEYLDLRPAIEDRPDAAALDRERVQGALVFRDVTFTYPGATGRPTLQNVNFRVQPGQLAAIVGPSGAGKTSTAYLISRLYDVDSGAVELDGVDIRALRLSSLGETVGMVTQESFLLHATIAENLRYGRPDADDGELVAAATAAHIHDRIVEFPGGYDTVVGERGYRLSGGEKQRLAIARVLLSDPRVLILDEATSSLDTTSERLVQRALEPLMSGRTTVAIAHRLSTILAADIILVLEGGRLVERGTHASLLARGGLYARLYAEQFGSGEIEARCADGVVLRSGTVVPVRSAS